MIICKDIGPSIQVHSLLDIFFQSLSPLSTIYLQVRFLPRRGILLPCTTRITFEMTLAWYFDLNEPTATWIQFKEESCFKEHDNVCCCCRLSTNERQEHILESHARSLLSSVRKKWRHATVYVFSDRHTDGFNSSSLHLARARNVSIADLLRQCVCKRQSTSEARSATHSTKINGLLSSRRRRRRTERKKTNNMQIAR